MWEAPVKIQRASVGLDVHARSVLGYALDGDTGEVFQRRLTPDHGEIVAWLGDLPGPVAVTYEAGPTSFGLARALTAAGIACEVAAPSKLIRPAGDRVKTDARDAAHLARLLRPGVIRDSTMSNHVAPQRMTLDSRPAGQLRFEGPSCGIQPAYFRLTRVATTRSTRTAQLTSTKRSGGPDDGRGRRFTLHS